MKNKCFLSAIIEMQSAGSQQEGGRPCRAASSRFPPSTQISIIKHSLSGPTGIFDIAFITLIQRNRSSRPSFAHNKCWVPFILLFNIELLVNMVKLLYGHSFCARKTFNKTRIEIWNLFHFNCWKNKKSEFILLNLAILTLVSSHWLLVGTWQWYSDTRWLEWSVWESMGWYQTRDINEHETINYCFEC